MLRLLAPLLLLALAGCYGTCSDYKNSLSTPPGCGCLENLYGCGPFDYPTGYGFTRAAATTVSVKSRTASETWRVDLNRESSTCPSLRPRLTFSVSASRAKEIWTIGAPQIGTARLSTRNGRRVARRRRNVASAGFCRVTMDLALNSVPAIGSSVPVTVQGDVNCLLSGLQCRFSYRGRVSRR
jgi:hypothetical protein